MLNPIINTIKDNLKLFIALEYSYLFFVSSYLPNILHPIKYIII